MCPDQGSNQQCRYLPWVGMEPATFRCTGRCSDSLSHARQGLHFLILTSNSVLTKGVSTYLVAQGQAIEDMNREFLLSCVHVFKRYRETRKRNFSFSGYKYARIKGSFKKTIIILTFILFTSYSKKDTVFYKGSADVSI